MKTATIPPLRVTQKLRRAARSVLREGETLSGFVEDAIKANINRRRVQREFMARGLASRDEARSTGEYVEAEAVLAELDAMLSAARRKAKSRR